MFFPLVLTTCCTVFCDSATSLSFWLTLPTTSTPVSHHKWCREAIKTQNISHWSAAQLISQALLNNRTVCILQIGPPRFRETFSIRNVWHPLRCHSQVWSICEKVKIKMSSQQQEKTLALIWDSPVTCDRSCHKSWTGAISYY